MGLGLWKTSRPPISTFISRNESGGRGSHPLEGGLSTGAGTRESCCCWAHIIRHQVGALGPPLRETFKAPTLIKVNSVKSDF